MKRILVLLVIACICSAANAQTEFIGIIKYRMTVVGADDKNEDSMRIVFDKNRILITLYLPDQDANGKAYQSNIIEDFANNREYVMDESSKSFKNDTLIKTSILRFTDTKKTANINNVICTKFMADTASLDKSLMRNAGCMTSMNDVKKSIKEFIFINMQPVVLDNRIVMDFIAEDPDGNQPRIYVKEMIPMQKVDEYFDLSKYKEVN